jgi:hypothetical protein
MKKAKMRRYTAHLDYDLFFDAELLNMKIKIYDEDYEKNGVALYEGNVGTFIKERIPVDYVVERIAELRYKDKVSYKLHGGENIIERIR